MTKKLFTQCITAFFMSLWPKAYATSPDLFHPQSDTCRPSGQTMQDNDKYILVWQDEFNVDGPLNPNDWDYERGFVRNQEPQWYQPQNAVCEQGNLVITARKEEVNNPYFDAQSSDWQLNRQHAAYTSSSVITKGKHELKFGRIEVRAKIPVSSGAWPAIWCLGNKDNNGEWPACGEVDILEFYSHHIWANACWSKDGSWNAQWNSCKTPFTHFTKQDSAWADKYHIWRMDWDENSIRLFLDNEKLNEIPISQISQPITSFCKVSNPFNTPLYLILNLALRTPDGIDESKLPLKYYIDYVRFYERQKQ